MDKKNDLYREILSLFVRIPPEGYPALKKDLDAVYRRMKMRVIKGGKADPVPSLKSKFTL
jgi:hypothetical protein